MATGSRMPERLRELYAALGNDSLLVRGSLARPALVDRLARNFYAYDSRIHAQEQREAERIREESCGWVSWIRARIILAAMT